VNEISVTQARAAAAMAFNLFIKKIPPNTKSKNILRYAKTHFNEQMPTISTKYQSKNPRHKHMPGMKSI
jgi:hypothetical protein